MATTEEERKTTYKCEYCGKNLRRYGRASLGYLKCVNPECTDPARKENPKHWTMQFETDHQEAPTMNWERCPRCAWPLPTTPEHITEDWETGHREKIYKKCTLCGAEKIIKDQK